MEANPVLSTDTPVIEKTVSISERLMLLSLPLILGYLVVYLLTALKFLAPDPLTAAFPYPQAVALALRLATLGLLSGVISGALVMTDGDDTPALHWTWRGWLALIVFTLIAGWLGWSDAPLFDLLTALLLAAFGVQITRRAMTWGGFGVVWLVGCGTAVIALLLSTLRLNDAAQDLALRTISGGMLINAAFPLLATALITCTLAQERQQEAYRIGGLLLIGGVIASVSPLRLFGGINAIIGVAGVIALPLIYGAALIFGARMGSRWWTLALVLWGIGGGVLGALGGAFNEWTLGTRLSDLQPTLMLIGTLAALIGLLERAQGYSIPFGFITVGAGVGFTALAGAGLVQVYLERLLGVGYLETQTLLIPLYWGWIVGVIAITLGVAWIGITALRR